MVDLTGSESERLARAFGLEPMPALSSAPASISDEALVEHIRKHPGISLEKLCFAFDLPWANPAPQHGYTTQARALARQLQRLKKENRLHLNGPVQRRWYAVEVPDGPPRDL